MARSQPSATYISLEREKLKLLRYELHQDYLERYSDLNIVPPGLSLHKNLNLTNVDPNLETRWNKILDHASNRLRDTAIEVCNKTKITIQSSIDNLKENLWNETQNPSIYHNHMNELNKTVKRNRYRLSSIKDRKLRNDKQRHATITNGDSSNVTNNTSSHNVVLSNESSFANKGVSVLSETNSVSDMVQHRSPVNSIVDNNSNRNVVLSSEVSCVYEDVSVLSDINSVSNLVQQSPSVNPNVDNENHNTVLSNEVSYVCKDVSVLSGVSGMSTSVENSVSANQSFANNNHNEVPCTNEGVGVLPKTNDVSNLVQQSIPVNTSVDKDNHNVVLSSEISCTDEDVSVLSETNNVSNLVQRNVFANLSVDNESQNIVLFNEVSYTNEEVSLLSGVSGMSSLVEDSVSVNQGFANIWALDHDATSEPAYLRSNCKSC